MFVIKSILERAGNWLAECRSPITGERPEDSIQFPIGKMLSALEDPELSLEERQKLLDSAGKQTVLPEVKARIREAHLKLFERDSQD